MTNNTPFDKRRLMSVNDAAHYTCIHPGTIRRWIRQGRVRAYGRRGVYRVMLEDVMPLAPVSAACSLQFHSATRTRTSTREE